MVNATFARFVPDQPLLQAGGMVLAWLASLAAGALFHRWVETPLSRLLTVRPRPLRFAPIAPAKSIAA